MTNEETIKILKTLIPKTCKMVNGRLKGGFDDTDCPEYKAIQIAINTLDKQNKKERKLGEITMTNEQKIKLTVKNMTTSDLAEYIMQHGSQCDHCIYDTYSCNEIDCEFGVEAWLKKKAD